MIIGISGKIKSGKDTVAEMLQYLQFQEKFDTGHSFEQWKEVPGLQPSFEGRFQVKKFAGKLKDMTCMFLGCTREQLEDRDYKNTLLGPEWSKDPMLKNTEAMHALMTPRTFMQKLGTEAIRNNLHPNAWVNALFADYSKDQNWIVSDTRFPNEVDSILDRGGIVIKVERPTEKRYPELWDEFKHSEFFEWESFLKSKSFYDIIYHPSETELDTYENFSYVIENDGTMFNLMEKVTDIYNEIRNTDS